MDAQELIDSNGDSGTVEVPPGEFFGQVTIDRPLIIAGKGTVSWIGSRTAPVIRIVCPGVTLKNLLVEIASGPDEVAIEAEPGTNPVLDNVVVRGQVVGVPPENITAPIVGQEINSQPISFVPPPPISLSNLEQTAAPSSASTSTDQTVRPTLPIDASVPPVAPAPSAKPSTRWSMFATLLAGALIAAVAVAFYISQDRAKTLARLKEANRIAALEQEKREKQQAIEKQREAERLAALEKERVEREKRERERIEKEKREQKERAEKEKREEEERVTRQRAFELEQLDKQTREWVKRGQVARGLREKIRAGLKAISKFRDQAASKLTSGYTSFAGNVQKGTAAWARRQSVDEATKGALANCDKSGGGCEELFQIRVVNATKKPMTIYVFHPWEPDLEKSNSLWSWTWEAGKDSCLGIDEGMLLVSKRFYLYATSSGVGWGPRPITLFNYGVTNEPDGRTLQIKLINASEK